MITEYIDDEPKTKQVSDLIKYKNTPMLRRHEFLSTVKQICNSAYGNLIKIGIIGGQRSGKSTMSMSIAHAIHKIMLEEHKMPFRVRVINEQDLSNLQEILTNLTPANYVLILDDVSALGETKGGRNILAKIQQFRNKQDTKIIMIYNYRFSKTLEKYLGNGFVHLRYVLTVHSEEVNDILRMILGKQFSTRLDKFRKIWYRAFYNGKWSALYDGDQKITYEYRNPFIPAIFHDKYAPRMIVSPTRKWQDADCDICESAEKEAGTS